MKQKAPSASDKLVLASGKNSPKLIVSILHQKLVTALRNTGQKLRLDLRWFLIRPPMSVLFQFKLLKNGAGKEIWTATRAFLRKAGVLSVHQKQLVNFFKKKKKRKCPSFF